MVYILPQTLPRPGALRRKRRFASAALLLRGLFASALGATSLAHLGAWGVLADTTDIGASSWLKRLGASGPWRMWLLGQLLGGSAAPWLRAFGRWRAKVIDISTVGIRGGTGDDLRLQAAYDLVTGQCTHLRLTTRTQGESLHDMALSPWDSAIGDAGYGVCRHIADVVACLAPSVVRVYLPNCPLFDGQGAGRAGSPAQKRAPQGAHGQSHRTAAGPLDG
ncbi:MAG: hypothetical protein WCG26_05735, partial [Chloroflexales bacterium]